MKLKQNKSSMQQQTSEEYVIYMPSGLFAKRPNPPTPEAVAKAQFVDKTYVWQGAAPKAQLP
jgi:hypothetical protein